MRTGREVAGFFLKFGDTPLELAQVGFPNGSIKSKVDELGSFAKTHQAGGFQFLDVMRDGGGGEAEMFADA